MDNHDIIGQMMAEEGGGGVYTSKSVVVTTSTSWGFVNAVGIRSIDFYFEGAKIPMVPGDGDYTFGSSSKLSAAYQATYAFNTTLSKTGSSGTKCWVSAVTSTIQRIYITFTTPITFDEIRVNNFHEAGGNTILGTKGVVFVSTEDTGVPPTNPATPVTGGVTIWSGDLDEHVASDVEDEQILTLI